MGTAGSRRLANSEAVRPYTGVFQPFVPEDSEKISRNRDIPRPFVIKPPLETKRLFVHAGRSQNISLEEGTERSGEAGLCDVDMIPARSE